MTLTTNKDLKIAVATNDEELYNYTNYFLQHKFEIHKCNTISDIITNIKEKKCNILVCDKTFDGLSISEIIKLLKKDNLESFIILRYNCDDSIDIDYYLYIGVNEFTCENSGASLLIHRINNIIASSNYANYSLRENIFIDVENKLIRKNNQEVLLTNTEFKLLLYFLDNKNTILDRKKLFNSISAHKEYTEEKSRIVDGIIKNIRKKTNIMSIRTIRSEGYIWVE